MTRNEVIDKAIQFARNNGIKFESVSVVREFDTSWAVALKIPTHDDVVECPDKCIILVDKKTGSMSFFDTL